MAKKNHKSGAKALLPQLAAPRCKFGPIKDRPITSIFRRSDSLGLYDEAQILELMQLIATVGFLTPVSVDPSGTIIVGERLVEAAKRLGLSRVPVTVLPVNIHLPFLHTQVTARLR